MLYEPKVVEHLALLPEHKMPSGRCVVVIKVVVQSLKRGVSSEDFVKIRAPNEDWGRRAEVSGERTETGCRREETGERGHDGHVLRSHSHHGRKSSAQFKNPPNNDPSLQKLQLTIAADLENIASLVPADDDFEYFFKVRVRPPLLPNLSCSTVSLGPVQQLS